ncbi:MAG: penicillin-binding protein 2 [bacterium]|nr:penicillin-binding protein 2 [bacterium]MDZ4296683.1 penicillin-binding protein 2 [Patescibacteria group bacterium]
MTGQRRSHATRRLYWLGGALLVCYLVVVVRLVQIMVLRHDQYVTLAGSQHNLVKKLSPDRGEIFFQDRFGKALPAAVNREAYLLSAAPKTVSDPEHVAALLAGVLEVPAPPIAEKLGNRQASYAVLAPSITPGERTAIEALALDGIHLSPVPQRSYPRGETAAVVTGFHGFRDGYPAGQYGLEEFYDEALRGKEGQVRGERDTLGRIIFSALDVLSPARSGDSLYLTIDPNVQAQLALILRKTLERWEAPSGAALVMEPRTGKIRAMVSLPSHDPNDYAKAENLALFVNRLVQERYEPGSVFKPFTMAGGLEERVVRPETTYDDPGEVRIGKAVIRNFDNNKHGVQTMTQVLEKSLNTGVIHVLGKLGKERFLDTVKAFGFGQKSGIDTVGEVASDIASLETFHDLQFATATFGQGIAVTPIALARALAAIANGGELVTPYLVDYRRTADGAIVMTEPKVTGRAIGKATAETLTRMLVSVVDHGAGYRHAQVPGYSLAAKTGTAQIPGPDGGYIDDVTHTIVSFGPGSDPKFVLFFKIDRPQGNRFAANTLTPALHEMAKFLFEYYEIPPDRPEQVEKHQE